MNNLKPYNLSKFNINSDANDSLEIEMNCYERYNSTVTFSKNTELKIICDENLNNKSNLSMTTPEVINLGVNINFKASLLSFIIIELNTNENINNNIYLSSNSEIKNDFEENFDYKINAATQIDFEVENTEDLKNISNIGKNILFKGYIQNEELITNFSGNFIDNKILNIETLIKPGKTLIIDSNNFTVFVNDENVLNSYSGEWINLSREIEGIEISATEGNNITGEVIYKEYYL